VVMTGRGNFVEVQGTAEGAPYSKAKLDEMLALAAKGIQEIFDLQANIIGKGFGNGPGPVDSN